MVDVNILVEEHRLIEGLTGTEILGATAHQQCADTFVGGRQPRAQGARTLLTEVRPFYGLRNKSAADPSGNVADVECEAGFYGRPVELAEHAAPLPLRKQLRDRVILPIRPKLRQNSSQRHELRLVRQIAGTKNL
jgi:hypothetical protein